MAGENIPTQLPSNIGKAILDPLNHALAAGEREALKVGVPTHDVVEMLLNHLASVVAMVEPPQARALVVEGLVENFATMVRKHIDAMERSPGGIIVPRQKNVSEAIHG